MRALKETVHVVRGGLVACLFALLASGHADRAAAQDESRPASMEVAEATSPATESPQPAPAPLSMTVPADQVDLKLMPLTRADLAEEAARVRDLARSGLEDLAAAKIQLKQATGQQATAVKQRVDRLARERRDAFERLATVLAAWEAKGGDPAAIAEYRQYMEAVTAEGVKSADTSTLVAAAGKWLVSREGGIALGVKLLGVVAAFFVLLFVAKFVSSLARRGVKRVPNLSTLLANFMVRASFVATLFLGLMIVLAMMGVDMGPVFAVVGGASFIAAFALQSTLSNFAAGLMIMVYKPFDVGNVVTLAGVSGTVKEVSLVSTTLTTPDNQVITIPNGNVWGSIITNVTVNDTRRVDLVFGIAYGDDADKASRIMEEVVKAHPLVLADPAPVIRLNQLADSSVNFVCRPWARTGDYWAVYWDLTQQVKQRFDEEGISIPFPQRDVHVYNHT
jgi:small conductance mechanosensitive channel